MSKFRLAVSVEYCRTIHILIIFGQPCYAYKLTPLGRAKQIFLAKEDLLWYRRIHAHSDRKQWVDKTVMSVCLPAKPFPVCLAFDKSRAQPDSPVVPCALARLVVEALFILFMFPALHSTSSTQLCPCLLQHLLAPLHHSADVLLAEFESGKLWYICTCVREFQ